MLINEYDEFVPIQIEVLETSDKSIGDSHKISLDNVHFEEGLIDIAKVESWRHLDVLGRAECLHFCHQVLKIGN